MQAALCNRVCPVRRPARGTPAPMQKALRNSAVFHKGSTGLPAVFRKARGASGRKLDLTVNSLEKSDAEWKQELTSAQYRVLRRKGTEPAGTGEYDRFYPIKGYFVCAGCGNPLYSAESKFKSGCGWPAFDKCYNSSVRTEVDNTLGMRRIEILCAKCDGHLGHVFEGERFTPTNERHCVNSVSVKYIDSEAPPGLDEGKVEIVEGAGGGPGLLSLRNVMYFLVAVLFFIGVRSVVELILLEKLVSDGVSFGGQVLDEVLRARY
mmetsp:Transcript_587/g.701  ORF Transcript_587/g.701 Transcript_587/m.701 type:complete len:264 (-) Transcript_587:40-831(-)